MAFPPQPRFGAYIGAKRHVHGLTQQQVADAIDQPRAWVGNAEAGRYTVIYPDKFNALHDLLGFPGWEALDLLGYKTDGGGLEGINGDLFVLIKNLSPEVQRGLIPLVRAVVST